MQKIPQQLFWVIGVIVIVAGGIFTLWKIDTTPGPLDGFTQCLADKDTVFYGAFWCTHCQNQKKLFGKSSKLLPYVECSTPDGRGQTQECIDKGIGGYPTWEFADGSRESGEVSLERLSEKSGCLLP